MKVAPQRTQKLQVERLMDWILLRKLVLLEHLAVHIAALKVTINAVLSRNPI